MAVTPGGGTGSGTGDDLVLSYRYSAGGQRYWTDECAGQPDCEATYYVLDGAETVGVFIASGALTYWNASGAGRHLADGSRRYYLTDHLGSVRTVVDGTGSPVEARDYYPYGLELPGRSVQASPPTKEGFTGHEKDASTGLVYAGARYYMPAVPRWTAVDPLAEKYPDWSPYNYVMGHPTGAFDPDGRLVIFINGFPFDGSTGRRYWNGFYQEAMSRMRQGERAVFLDGSRTIDRRTGKPVGYSNYSKPGRISSAVGHRRLKSSLNADTRIEAGYKDGQRLAAGIIGSLAENRGVITETVKIFTHSMGAAYARGFVKALSEYVNENDIKGFSIEFQVDIAAFQGGQLQAMPSVQQTFQVGALPDVIANGSIDGAEKIGGAQGAASPGKAHSVSNFSAEDILDAVVQWARENNIPVTVSQ